MMKITSTNILSIFWRATYRAMQYSVAGAHVHQRLNARNDNVYTEFMYKFSQLYEHNNVDTGPLDPKI